MINLLLEIASSVQIVKIIVFGANHVKSNVNVNVNIPFLKFT